MLAYLANLLRTLYAPHLLFTEFQDTLEDIRKIIESMATKVDIDLEPPILTKPEAVDETESELKVVDEPELESEVGTELVPL